MQAEQAWLDLVLPGGMKVPQGVAAAPGESLQAVMTRAAAQWRHWIVRVDQAAEPELLNLENLASVTLLTGADDPAVVASYQLIKGLKGKSGESGPALKLVIMGADDAKAEEAERSLRRATSTFLSRPIDAAVRVAKIGSSMAVQIFRGKADLTIGQLLDTIQSTKGAAPAPRPATPKPPTLTIPTIPQAARRTPADAATEPKSASRALGPTAPRTLNPRPVARSAPAWAPLSICPGCVTRIKPGRPPAHLVAGGGSSGSRR